MKLPEAAATGIGSVPGTDIKDAVAATFGELPDFPYLPELPGRGPGADMIGRSAALLVDLPVELYAGRWQIASRPGLDLRRAQDLLERDLDTLAEQGDGFGGTLKIQSAGPWTLAAAVELALGGAVLKDHMAVRDLSDSLAEGLRTHLTQISRRLPGASLVLQLDEPSLPAVLAGQVPTQSGLHTYRSVSAATARATLASIVDTIGVPVIVHCCASDAPIALLREAGAAGLALDLSKVTRLDPLGEALDAGLTLLAGVTAPPSFPSASAPPAPGSSTPVSAKLARQVSRLWHELGFPLTQLPGQVVVTPACGLAGTTPAYARDVIKACREAALRLREEAA